MNTVAVTTDSKTIAMIELTLIQESPDNPRQTYDQNALQELAKSIASEGIQVPLLVRVFEGEARHELIAGHRRIRAAKIAGLTEVPCVLRQYTDEEARAARIIENLLREGLTPLDEAEAYQQMFAAAGAENRPLTPADLAAKLGKKESYVRLRLRLLSADAAVQEALRKEQITEGHALEIARLDKSLQRELLQFCLFDRWNNRRESLVSINELRKFISQNVMLVLASAPFNTNDAKLIPNVGACTDCSKRTGNDRMLFPDVKQKDICTLPTCYHAKVNRTIDVTLEELKASNTEAVRISTEYGRSSTTPKDVLSTNQYEVVKKGTVCEDTKVGVYIDGPQQGQKVKVCTNSKCSLHFSYSVQPGSSSPDMKEKRAKARKEAAVRSRVFAAIYTASASVSIEDEDYIAVAQHSISRADHNGLMKLAKLLDWPKEVFAWDGKAKLAAKLKEIGADAAMVVAMLAAASHELSVNEFTDRKAERLEALAKSFSVNTTSIRKEVEAELTAKTKPNASPTAKPTPATNATTPTKKASPKTAAKKPAKKTSK
jgi:ParB family transcriptional regulator, chromosome partitioning protein